MQRAQLFVPVSFSDVEPSAGGNLRFTLFTEKSVSQCMRTLQERMEVKATKTRPAINGWAERKTGKFSITVTLPVFWRIKRTTRLNGEAKRERGVTVIDGYVSDGVSPHWQRILFGVLFIVCVLLIVTGQALLAVLSLVVGVAAFVPMIGDYKNSDVLLIEVERHLKASPNPPKSKS